MESHFFENLFPFLSYGVIQPNFAIFYHEQEDNYAAINSCREIGILMKNVHSQVAKHIFETWGGLMSM
jgi:hypothetical protein